MIVGLISDTHGYLDPAVEKHFQTCDEIWHAGDIGSMEVLDLLEQLKPTFAVYGNIDDRQLRFRCPEDLWLERCGVSILITHIAGSPPRYTSRIRSLLDNRSPRILICGHSHILKVTRDPGHGRMIFINPGAAGRQGLHRVKTIMRMHLNHQGVKDLEVIELGKRGAL